MTRGGDSKKALSRFWDESYDYYRQAAAANPEASAERRVLLAHLSGEERILDLGSGSCENALWLPEGCRYVGLDVSTSALRLAAEWERPGLRVRGNGERLPFAEAGFDVVLSTYAVEHLHDPLSTFLEVARVLRPGGLLLLVGSAWDLPYEIPPSLPRWRRLDAALRRSWRQMRSLLDRSWRFDIVRQPRVLIRGYTPDADAVFIVQSHLLAGYLQEVGFDILEHRCLSHRADPGGVRGWLRNMLRHVPLWKRGWGNCLIVARRGGEIRRPTARLLPL